jgi:hypothetical protein
MYVLHIFIYVNYTEAHVHKTMLLQTLVVTDIIVRTSVRKFQGGNCISLEKRGCYKPVPQVLNISNNDITSTAYLHNELDAKF